MAPDQEGNSLPDVEFVLVMQLRMDAYVLIQWRVICKMFQMTTHVMPTGATRIGG